MVTDRRRLPRAVPRLRGHDGRPRSSVDWERLGRVVLVIVIFCVLASYIGPLLNLGDAWRDSRAAQANLKEVRSESRALRRRAEDLSRPEVLESEARRLGLISEGERPYVVKGLP